jgi:hypothetical protein
MHTVVLFVVAMLAMGACSNGSSSKTSSSNPNASKKTDAACKLVTEDDATKLFGVAAEPGDNSSPGTETSVCIWTADDTENHSFILQVRVYDDIYHYGGDLFPQAEKLSGLGDKAFVSKGKSIAGTDVQFVKDGKTFAVNYAITNVMAKTKKTAADQADQLVEIVKENSSDV